MGSDSFDKAHTPKLVRQIEGRNLGQLEENPTEGGEFMNLAAHVQRSLGLRPTPNRKERELTPETVRVESVKEVVTSTALKRTLVGDDNKPNENRQHMARATIAVWRVV